MPRGAERYTGTPINIWDLKCVISAEPAQASRLFPFTWVFSLVHFRSDAFIVVEHTGADAMEQGQVLCPPESYSHSQRRRVRQLPRSLSSLLRLLRMRKVKHLTVNLTPILDQDGGQIWWALVYVPQGTTAGSIQLATTAALSDMYEPNQYVMNCGIVDPTAGPIRFSSPISRNLNNGDAIVLLVRHTLGGNMDIRGTCRYAITLQ